MHACFLQLAELITGIKSTSSMIDLQSKNKCHQVCCYVGLVPDKEGEERNIEKIENEDRIGNQTMSV